MTSTLKSLRNLLDIPSVPRPRVKATELLVMRTGETQDAFLVNFEAFPVLFKLLLHLG